MRDPVAVSVPPAGPRFFRGALACLLLVAVGYEALFVFRGINKLDESWQLYAAMRLHAGGVLYRDVLWVFPPGHVWTAWIAWWIAPPGLVASRIIYGLFCVALSVASWLLARRLMPEPFALLGALLVTLAAPRGHVYQLLFAYRYLVFPVLALMALDRRLRGGGPAWILVAGLLVGVSVTFRLTPAFSVACGICVALVATHARWRDGLADGLRFGLGILLATAPVLLWFQHSVGLARMWQEVVLHPLAMLQPLPPPDLEWPRVWTRSKITGLFVAVEFRAIWLLYGGYAVALLALWVRARRRGAPFRHGLLTALAVFGAVFFLRSTGRSDEPHLDSVIPPACLLVAHLASQVFVRVFPADRRRPFVWWSTAVGVAAALLASWIFLLDTDELLRPREVVRLRATGRTIATSPVIEAFAIDRTVDLIEKYTQPDDVILNMAPTPMFHILTGRTGPGWFDIMMPGTFLHEGDEAWFLERLEADPPAAVIWPAQYFDYMPERAIGAVAPHVTEWVRNHYVPAAGGQRRYIVLVPRKAS